MPEDSRRRRAELEAEIAAFRAAPIPTREQERAEVERMRAERRSAEMADEARLRAYQDRVDRYAAYGPSGQPPPAPVLGPSGNFRIKFYERDQPASVDYADDYGEALRKTRAGLLGTSGDRAELFLGKDLVNMANLEQVKVRGGMKYVVRFSSGGEKPRKLNR